MKKFKVQLSPFDIGMIVAFVVIGLLGGGAWYYLSGQLQQAKDAAQAAKSTWDANSSKGADTKYVVGNSNLKALQDDDTVLKSQIDPLIKTYLLGKDNTLPSVDREDPVAWKHRLDNDVSELNTLAKTHAVTVPANYYFGFSRYLNTNPNDEQTTVLRKQLLAIKTLTTIMINAGVNSIEAIQRTYEEDPHTPGQGSAPVGGESDHLSGFAATAQGNAYTAYPFEITFQTETENLRTVVDDVLKAPYVFVIRTLNVKNSAPDSPRKDDLDKMATASPDVAATPAPADPNATNAPAATRGPQYLFGSSKLEVKARIDLIEWTIKSADDATNSVAATPPPKSGAHHP